MYYDLIASLPYLPHFERAERLPITRLRLDERLRLLTPAHADQLARAQPLVRWRPERLLGTTDEARAKQYAELSIAHLDRSLRQYVDFCMNQQTLVAALRRKRNDLGVPDRTAPWGAGAWVRHVRTHWDVPDFRLAHLYPWLPEARDFLAAGDARNLERLLINAAWRWLDRCAEQNTFSFPTVFAYVFKWDMLRAWLANDVEKAKTGFRTLIDQVTHVEHN